MHYKTIVLELLQQQPDLYEQLRTSRQLLPTLETKARELKTSHEQWTDTLSQARPGSTPLKVTSEAMELAIQQLQDHLLPALQPDGNEALSLDEAMAYLRNHRSAD